jgi:hypothetical protein
MPLPVTVQPEQLWPSMAAPEAAVVREKMQLEIVPALAPDWIVIACVEALASFRFAIVTLLAVMLKITPPVSVAPSIIAVELPVGPWSLVPATDKLLSAVAPSV